MSSKVYPLARNLPVWKFYYPAENRHHIRRTIAVIEETKDNVTAYELRRGNTVYSCLQEAPVKTYKKSKIAKIGQLDPRSPVRQKAARNKKSQTETTLSKYTLADLVLAGA